MDHLAQSANVRASQVKAIAPEMIEWAIVATLAPIRAELREQWELITAHGVAYNSLAMRIEACEQGGCHSADFTTLRAYVAGLMCDMDELKSIDFSMLSDTIDPPEVPSTEMPAIS